MLQCGLLRSNFSLAMFSCPQRKICPVLVLCY
jgi:hypothetical protein